MYVFEICGATLLFSSSPAFLVKLCDCYIYSGKALSFQLVVMNIGRQRISLPVEYQTKVASPYDFEEASSGN